MPTIRITQVEPPQCMAELFAARLKPSFSEQTEVYKVNLAIEINLGICWDNTRPIETTFDRLRQHPTD